MPYWEFVCKDCRCFLNLSIAHGEACDEIRCPVCDTSRLELQSYDMDEGSGLQTLFARIADLEARLSRIEGEAPTEEHHWT